VLSPVTELECPRIGDAGEPAGFQQGGEAGCVRILWIGGEQRCHAWFRATEFQGIDGTAHKRLPLQPGGRFQEHKITIQKQLCSQFKQAALVISQDFDFRRFACRGFQDRRVRSLERGSLERGATQGRKKCDGGDICAEKGGGGCRHTPPGEVLQE